MEFFLPILAFLLCCNAQTIKLNIPKSPPPGAAELDKAPLGISYEFFAFPSYFSNVSATIQCMKNLQELSGTWPPIRIGGTTQDRADYYENLQAHVSYSVKDPKDAPPVLTYGPSFFSLAAKYPGIVVLGLNRGHDNIQNTVSAAKRAVSSMPNLLALELGNEPEYYVKDKQKIAQHPGGWTPQNDAHSQGDWQTAIGRAVGKERIIQASNSLQSPPAWGAQQLISAQNATAQNFIKLFSHHNYPGGNIQSLMSHVNIARNLDTFREDIKSANRIGRDYVFGETNSATGGGAASVSPTFGAAIWVADYSLRAVSSNIKRLYFHHGTIGNCQYCWWGRNSMGAPYYGAYFAAAALGGGSRIVAIDDGKSNYGGFAVYAADGKVLRIALFNTDYFDGGSARAAKQFQVNGLDGAAMRVRRLTAPSAGSRVDRGQSPAFDGQTFADRSCEVQGRSRGEVVRIQNGGLTLELYASEGVLLDFQK